VKEAVKAQESRKNALNKRLSTIIYKKSRNFSCFFYFVASNLFIIFKAPKEKHPD
jgi:hypothetical protein